LRNFLQPPGRWLNSQRAIPVLHAGGGYHDGHEPSQGIYQNMAFATLDQFPGIETAYSRNGGALDALAIQTSRRGVFMTPGFLP
jgi:hypothetical protein